MNREHTEQPQGSEEHSPRSATRRTFLKAAAATAAAAGMGGLQRPLRAQGAVETPLRAQDASATGDPDGAIGPQPPEARAQTAFDIKVANAEFQFNKPIPKHPTNGDEARFPSKIGNFHKGLPTINAFGEVDLDAYQRLIDALTSGEFADFEAIPLGGTARLVNPQAGLAFDTEGVDSHQLAIPPAPGVASAERAAEAVELYWMALARDVPFTRYGREPITQGAIADLNRVSAFAGVTPVTAQTLFRLGLGGPTFRDLIGPYVSQFLLVPFTEGVIPIEHKIRTYKSLADGGRDFLTTEDEWLAAQQGNVTVDESAVTDPILRHVRSGRDLGQYAHIDVLFQSCQQFLNAKSILGDGGSERPKLEGVPSAPLSPSNPYVTSRTQEGFATLGAGAFDVSMIGELTRRALQAIWFQKWFVHRALRPEAFGGLVHFQLTQGRYPFLHPDILTSPALPRVFARHGTYFLPQEYPEGSPLHPSHGSGHAAIAGACATLLKAFYDESTRIVDLFTPQVATPDGLSLTEYTGPDVTQMTVGSELNKLASNVAIGRGLAGVHWRDDAVQGLLLGEQVAIAVLQDVKQTLNEFRTGGFKHFTFHDFQGNPVSI
jgi:membrane-associated phospholipid phosphatase